MSFSDRHRVVACAGVVAAALITGACGATGAAAPPPPLPAPSAAPASAPAAPGAVLALGPAEPWDSIARCETGGDWHADTGNGHYGGLQLSPRTWAAHGGGQFAPEADEASREQQILVGDRIRAEQGWGAWSSCADAIAPR
jgi:hypothetical protein